MTPESLERSLKNHPFCSELSNSTIAFLCGCTKNVRFSADEYLFKENERADSLYLIRSGRVALESHQPGKPAIKVETLTSGGVLGWSTLFPPFRWYVDCRALEPTLAFAVDGSCLRGKLDQDAAFAYSITRRLLLEVHRRLERARLQQLDVYKGET